MNVRIDGSNRLPVKWRLDLNEGEDSEKREEKKQPEDLLRATIQKIDFRRILLEVADSMEDGPRKEGLGEGSIGSSRGGEVAPISKRSRKSTFPEEGIALAESSMEFEPPEHGGDRDGENDGSKGSGEVAAVDGTKVVSAEVTTLEGRMNRYSALRSNLEHAYMEMCMYVDVCEGLLGQQPSLLQAMRVARPMDRLGKGSADHGQHQRLINSHEKSEQLAQSSAQLQKAAADLRQRIVANRSFHADVLALRRRLHVMDIGTDGRVMVAGLATGLSRPLVLLPHKDLHCAELSCLSLDAYTPLSASTHRVATAATFTASIMAEDLFGVEDDTRNLEPGGGDSIPDKGGVHEGAMRLPPPLPPTLAQLQLLPLDTERAVEPRVMLAELGPSVKAIGVDQVDFLLQCCYRSVIARNVFAFICTASPAYPVAGAAAGQSVDGAWVPLVGKRLYSNRLAFQQGEQYVEIIMNNDKTNVGDLSRSNLKSRASAAKSGVEDDGEEAEQAWLSRYRKQLQNPQAFYPVHPLAVLLFQDSVWASKDLLSQWYSESLMQDAVVRSEGVLQLPRGMTRASWVHLVELERVLSEARLLAARFPGFEYRVFRPFKGTALHFRFVFRMRTVREFWLQHGRELHLGHGIAAVASIQFPRSATDTPLLEALAEMMLHDLELELTSLNEDELTGLTRGHLKLRVDRRGGDVCHVQIVPDPMSVDLVVHIARSPHLHRPDASIRWTQLAPLDYISRMQMVMALMGRL